MNKYTIKSSDIPELKVTNNEHGNKYNDDSAIEITSVYSDNTIIKDSSNSSKNIKRKSFTCENGNELTKLF